ncbi:MAG TPA: arsenite methyltransferase [Nitrososphaera sp.]|jgi:SAM-dependent methyltransferase|nr:arsenite methyltransferase [Nitrososphaera sp.]
MEKKRQQNIKQTIRRNYGKIALEESSKDACCGPGCCSSPSPSVAATDVGYDSKELQTIPEASVLGVGCGAPVKFASLQKGETVVDLGSGAGIDVFLSANDVGATGNVIGIDMTDEMLERARRNAKNNNYSNVEFKKGDIEKRIPVSSDSVDAVISNCVINLTTDKVKAFKEVLRILKSKGRMVISDLVADRKAGKIDVDQWSACIDGAMSKQDYLASIKKAGFRDATVLEEREFAGGELVGGRKITTIVIRAVKS